MKRPVCSFCGTESDFAEVVFVSSDHKTHICARCILALAQKLHAIHLMHMPSPEDSARH